LKALECNKDVPTPIGPYSTAIISGSTLYFSGQIGIDPQTASLVPGGVTAEVKQIFTNLDSVLKSLNLNSSNVLMASIFLLKMSDFKIVNELYAEWVNGKCPPARQTVAVSELPANANIEISIVAEIV